MPSKTQSPQQILSEAFTRRAEAYRRWRDAAEHEHSPAVRDVYRELAALECDRFEEIAARFFRQHSESLASEPAAPRLRDQWSPPEAGRPALRAAADLAERESQNWAARLRKTAESSPERPLLEALLDDARRAQDLVSQAPRPKGS